MGVDSVRFKTNLVLTNDSQTSGSGSTVAKKNDPPAVEPEKGWLKNPETARARTAVLRDQAPMVATLVNQNEPVVPAAPAAMPVYVDSTPVGPRVARISELVGNPALSGLIFDVNDPNSPFKLSRAQQMAGGLSIQQPGDLFTGQLVLNLGELVPPQILPNAKPFAIETHGNQYVDKNGAWTNKIFMYPLHVNPPEMARILHASPSGVLINDKNHLAKVVGGPAARLTSSALQNGFSHEDMYGRAFKRDAQGNVVPSSWRFTQERTYNDADPVYWGGPLDVLRNYASVMFDYGARNMVFKQPLPENWPQHLEAYDELMGTAAALHTLVIPFTNEDNRAYQRDFRWHDVKLDSIEKFKPYLDLLADPSSPETTLGARDFVHYCAMAVNTVLAQQNIPFNEASTQGPTPLLSETAFKKLKDMEAIFKGAGGHEKGDAHKGWEALARTEVPGTGRTYINAEQLKLLQAKGLVDVPLKLSPSWLKPLMSYEPVGMEVNGAERGMPKTALSVADMVISTFAMNFPRYEIEKQFTLRLKESFAASAQAAKLMAQSIGLASESADEIAEKAGKALTSKYLAGILASPDFKRTIQETMNYKLMTDNAKRDWEKNYAAALGTVGNDALGQEERAALLRKLADEEQQRVNGYDIGGHVVDLNIKTFSPAGPNASLHPWGDGTAAPVIPGLRPLAIGIPY
ncbi:MAG: hypothetical protein K1X64_16945 [Myxococcaceae bacterium]|nr:hypothetical protein [Myxococcaceae bacterium]